MPEGTPVPEPRDKDSTALCPGCLSENPPRAPFCHKCGMPIGMISTLDPIQVIYSTGWVFRRAIAGGRWPLAFWGMLLIFGPTALLIAVSLALFPRYSSSDTGLIGAVLWALFFGGLYLVILIRVTKSYVRHLTLKPGACEKCGYTLAHLPEPRCPECGTPFRPEELLGDSASDATADWTLPDCSRISEAEFPIDCESCGCSISGLGDAGSCPKCSAPFSRPERLVELYGPEVFITEMPARRPKRAPARNLRGAILLTGVAIVAAVLFPSLTASGFIGGDRWPFVVLLLIAALVAWVRALRDEPD